MWKTPGLFDQLVVLQTQSFNFENGLSSSLYLKLLQNWETLKTHTSILLKAVQEKLPNRYRSWPLTLQMDHISVFDSSAEHIFVSASHQSDAQSWAGTDWVKSKAHFKLVTIHSDGCLGPKEPRTFSREAAHLSGERIKTESISFF